MRYQCLTEAFLSEATQRGSASDRRYRALLQVSDIISSHPDLSAVLRSLSDFLPAVIPFDLLGIVLVDEPRSMLKLHALTSKLPNEVPAEIGEEIPLSNGVITEVVETQKPFVVEDIDQETREREIVRRARAAGVHSACILPLTSARRRLGALLCGTAEKRCYSVQDLELMMRIASYISVALDNAISHEAVQAYQRELAHERDRLKLLLEINNHLISHLELSDLLHAVSKVLRRAYDHDFTALLLYDESAKSLRNVAVDFPDVEGPIDVMEMPLSADGLLELHRHAPRVREIDEVRGMFPAIADLLASRQIASVGSVPLVSPTGPIGVLVLGCARPDAFLQEHLDLLLQVGNQIALAVENAIAYGRISESHTKVTNEKLYLESEIQTESNFEDIVGRSEALKRVLEQVEIVAGTDSTVLLLGDTGTGKELLARAIHRLSPRNERTFVKLNCAAIPSGLVESELFGHERGAFTGALAQKIGRFELAHKGTLFLDEVGDIPLELQAKLLRALQEHEFERLGSTKTQRVDVRVVAATNRNLSQMVESREFRSDLFYRLNVFPILVPALRERREDIPLLVHYFVSRFAARMGKKVRTIPSSAMDVMMRWHWPGNIRELENFIERAVILTQGDTLFVPVSEISAPAPSGDEVVCTFEDVERKAIIDCLRRTNGRISGPNGAAALLGLKRTTLQNKMRRLGISRNG